MPVSRARELLLGMLEDDFPTAQELREFLTGASREDEGQWCDWKSARGVNADRKAAGRELRKDLSAFANADGGFLVLGYNEATDTFEHVASPGGQHVEQWLSNVLTRLAPMQFRSRALRFEERDGAKDVLVVAVGRALRLLHTDEAGETAYYLRLGHQTLRLPPWHVADLMLGRRAQPVLSVKLWRASPMPTRANYGDAGNLSSFAIDLILSVENDALTNAEGVRAGMVCYCPEPSGASLPAALQRSIRHSPPQDWPGNLAASAWSLHHNQQQFLQPARTLGPFDVSHHSLHPWRLPILIDEPERPPAPLPRVPTSRGVELFAALYVVARDGEPVWHQLRFRYRQNVTATPDLAPQISIAPSPFSRPLVAVALLEPGEPVVAPL